MGVIVGFRIAAMLAGSALTLACATARPSEPPREVAVASVAPPSVVTAPAATPRPPATGGAIRVPESIDATGTVDVSASLNAWLDGVPDGSIVRFPRSGIFRLGAGLALHERRDLTLEGNGATLQSSGTGAWESSLLRITSSAGIAVRNLRLEGNSPTPGMLLLGQEYAHGVFVVGSRDVDLSGVTIEGVFGDGLAVEDWSDGLSFHDSQVTSAGRNGVSILAGSNVHVERVAFTQTGGSVFDIEPWQSSGGARNVEFRDNSAGTRGITDPEWGVGLLFAANGAEGSTVENVTVSGTTVAGDTIAALVDHPTRRRNIVFTNNRSDTPARGGPYGGPVLVFNQVDGLTVNGNVQPMEPGADLLEVRDSTGVSADPAP